MSTAYVLPESLRRAYAFVKWVEQTWPPEVSPFSKTNRAENVQARRICWYILRVLWQLKYRQIADLFEVNHSTIVMALQRITPDLVENAKAIESEFWAYVKEEGSK